MRNHDSEVYENTESDAAALAVLWISTEFSNDADDSDTGQGEEVTD